MPAIAPAFAKLIGEADDAKLVIAHADDIGMCHGANAAFRLLAGKGFITSGSVMVPCPWFRELAEMAVADPSLDIGVHLTLTSEWRHYRWRPITGARKTSGLVDPEGFMWRQATAVRKHADPACVETELRKQIDLAFESGIDVTHLDCHMGTALAAEFADIYVKLGRDYRLPVLFPRQWANYVETLDLGDVDPQVHASRVAKFDSMGHPVVTRFAETPWSAAADDDRAYETLIEGVGPGLTFLAFHPNCAGDIETIDPPRAHCRIHEARLFQDPAFLGGVRRQQASLIGFRAIRDRLRAAGAL